jgi:hypothetical protein
MFKLQTFSGNKEMKRSSFSSFVEDCFVLIGSMFDPLLLSEPDGDSDGLFFFASNRSFKFTVTSPMDISTFLITISLCPKGRDKAQLKTKYFFLLQHGIKQRTNYSLPLKIEIQGRL